MQKDPKEFWKDTGKMLGTAKKKTEGAKFIKNENGVEIRTSEEIVTAFRRRLMKTFSINEEDNGLFCKRTEREVEDVKTKWKILTAKIHFNVSKLT